MTPSTLGGRGLLTAAIGSSLSSLAFSICDHGYASRKQLLPSQPVCLSLNRSYILAINAIATIISPSLSIGTAK